MTTAEPSARILVTYKGETGYLESTVDSDFRVRCAMTLDPERASQFSSVARAERFARKVAGRFDRVEVEAA